MFVNMAVADLLTTLLQMPITISFLSGGPWISGLAGKITCKCFYYAAFTSITASILCLTIIAVDRYCAVMYPFRRIWWFRNAKIITPVIWVLSLALMSVSVTVITLNGKVRWCSYDFHQTAVSEKTFFIFFFVVNYLIRLIVTSILYAAIACKLWYHVKPNDNGRRNSQEEHQKKRKLVRMLIIIVAVFALCWLPVNVYQLELAAKHESSFPPLITYFCVLLSQGNSAINPWLYMGLNRKFRILGFTCAARNQKTEQRREKVELQRKAIQKEAERENSDSFENKL